MDAVTTAARVLAWAVEPAPPPPLGPLRRPGTLEAPGADVLAALTRLASVSAARLGAGSPPFGDHSSVGLGTLLLAAAVGGRMEVEIASALAGAVPAVRLTARTGWAESVLRHAVVAPVLAHPPHPTAGHLPDELVPLLLRASPLTAVLYRPLPGETGSARAAATRLLTRPRGPAVLVATLSAPSPDAEVLNWRAELLDMLRQDHPAVTLDVYGTARLWHGAAWDERIRWAKLQLSGRSLPDELPIATVRFWAPLERLDRDETSGESLSARITRTARATDARQSIRARRYLRPDEYHEAIRLVRTHHISPAAS